MLNPNGTSGVTPPKGTSSKECHYSGTSSDHVTPSSNQQMELANSVVATRLNFEPPPSNPVQHGSFNRMSHNPATIYSCQPTNMSTAATYSQSNQQPHGIAPNTHPEVSAFQINQTQAPSLLTFCRQRHQIPEQPEPMNRTAAFGNAQNTLQRSLEEVPKRGVVNQGTLKFAESRYICDNPIDEVFEESHSQSSRQHPHEQVQQQQQQVQPVQIVPNFRHSFEGNQQPLPTSHQSATNQSKEHLVDPSKVSQEQNRCLGNYTPLYLQDIVPFPEIANPIASHPLFLMIRDTMNRVRISQGIGLHEATLEYFLPKIVMQPPLGQRILREAEIAYMIQQRYPSLAASQAQHQSNRAILLFSNGLKMVNDKKDNYYVVHESELEAMNSWVTMLNPFTQVQLPPLLLPLTRHDRWVINEFWRIYPPQLIRAALAKEIRRRLGF